MDKRYYGKLEKLLQKQCIRILEEFCESEENKEVYAFALMGDDRAGTIAVAINTLEGLFGTVEKYYKNDADEALYSISGVKYNPPDFTFWYDHDQYSKEMQAALYQYYDFMAERTEGIESEKINWKRVETYRELYVQTLTRVINNIKPYFDKLHKTENFIAFATLYDIDDETVIKLMKETVSEEEFDSVFPEIRQYNDLKNMVAQKTHQEQVCFWLTAFMSYIIQPESEEARYFKKVRRNQYDMQKEIVALGQTAVPFILHTIENSIGDKAYDEVVQMLLMMLWDIGNGDDEAILGRIRDMKDSLLKNNENSYDYILERTLEELGKS